MDRAAWKEEIVIERRDRMARDQASHEGSPCSRSTVDHSGAVTIPACDVAQKLFCYPKHADLTECDIVASVMASVF